MRVLALAWRCLVVVGIGGVPSFGCNDGPEQVEPYVSPDRAGPWTVGTERFEFTSSTGLSLVVQVWFPSADEGSGAYFYDELIPGAASDGVAPDCSSARPVVLFSHGSGGIRWQSAYLPERLATRGYLVVAPDHKYNTFVDNDDDRFAELLLRRPTDIRDSYEWLLQRASAADDPLRGCVDPAAGYAVAGHSFGGYTSLALAGATADLAEIDAGCAAGVELACELAELWRADHPDGTSIDLSDDRVWAVLGLAPWDGAWFGEGVGAIAVPTVFLAADGDTSTPLGQMVRPLFDRLTVTPRALGVIADAGHASFIGLCDMASDQEGCGPGFRDPDEVNDLVRQVTAAFLDLSGGDERAREHWPSDLEGLTWTVVE